MPGRCQEEAHEFGAVDFGARCFLGDDVLTRGFLARSVGLLGNMESFLFDRGVMAQ